MKKIIAAILTMAFVCTLSLSTIGCGDKKTTKAVTLTTPAVTTGATPTTGK